MSTSPLPPLDPREQARVHAWLHRYGRETAGLAPLTERRYAARYRAYRIELVTSALVAVYFATQLLWTNVAQVELDTTGYLAGFVAAYAVLAGGSLLGLRHQRRADRALAATMRHRVARPVEVRPVKLLGGWFFLAAAAMYPGALAVGAGSLLGATHPTDRALSVAFTVGAAAFTGYAVAVTSHVISRPAIAADAGGLADDDALRREDARLAVAPYLAVLAVVAGAGMARGGVLLWVYLGYAALAALAWAVSLRSHHHRGTGPHHRAAAAS
jgi:hypothetical protein